MGVENANNKLSTSFWRTSRTIPTCDPAKIYFTTRYSGWNVQLRFWVGTTKHAM